MLSLTKSLNDAIAIGYDDWSVDLSFDNVLRWYELLDDESLDDGEKVLRAFGMFIGTGSDVAIDQQVAAVSKITDYIQQTVYGDSDDDEPATDLNGDPVPEERFFSYQQDADAIYSSFMADYHIDLIDVQGQLRWEKFKALLDGLSEKTQFKRIVAIRQRSTVGLEGEELTSLIEAQDYYRLDGEDTQANLDAQMGQVFGMLAEKAKEG
ncbi:Gp15 family bacteriophage protein [Lactiplantibacillus carotarum]|uniref:Gp15 family bacteriophage protein n=1 Tax=Lactiplantibacillus carotarum TaxID=2993456 RepID=UPI00298EFE33|nr:Gp15 family bacteriophage protein [Lactiplantibacillus carotarum]